MIKNPLLALHPSFDALSAYADLNDVDRAGSRLTRHVHACAECQETIREIVELGESVRVDAPVEMPAGLWSRIEGAAKAPESDRVPTAELTSPIWNGAPSLKPTTEWSTPKRNFRIGKWGVSLAAAAAAAGVLFWPGDSGLEASGTSRLTFAPGRPVPGGVVHVRYQPAPWLKGQPRLVLAARELRQTVSLFSLPPGDSVATLRPNSAGIYEGDFRLPAGSNGLWLAVSDSVAGETDIEGLQGWQLIAGTADGKPSLGALRSAAQSPIITGFPLRPSRQNVNPADSLRRYFPAVPGGWAYARPKEGKGSLFERMVAYFESSQRKYTSFYDELWPQKRVDAERLHEMFVFASAIDEPDEMNRWARRLALEHPEDPRALPDLVRALHQLELKNPPGLRDSIRPWLPVLDRLSTTSGSILDPYGMAQMVRRYADPAEVARWTVRLDSIAGSAYWMRDYESNAAHRARAEAVWLHDAQKSCVRPAGQFPFQNYFGDWQATCQRGRSAAFSYLARAKLLDGDARTAVAYTDSVQNIPYDIAPCGRFWMSSVTRMQANLMLGDTVSAQRAAATRLAVASWKGEELSDSLRKWFGSRGASPALRASVDSARRAYLTCSDSAKLARETRMKRFRSTE